MKDNKRILNDDIRASKVKLINEDSEVLWEMSLFEAKNKAQDLWLDLMQLWWNSDIVTVKMLDYWKFLYKQKKQDQKNKQKTKAPELKTIKLSFNIWEHDLEVKKNQAIRFFNDKNPLKVVLTLRGREKHYEDIARWKIEKFIFMLDEIYKIEKNIVKAWNNFIVMMNPK